MVSEEMSYVQFSSATQFFAACIPSSLTSAGSTDMTAPK
jgi:hypothetical protein